MSHSTHSLASALPQAVPYRQPQSGNDLVKGCSACAAIAPQLTAAGTSGRTWRCGSCGTSWVHGSHDVADCARCAGVMVREADSTLSAARHLDAVAGGAA